MTDILNLPKWNVRVVNNIPARGSQGFWEWQTDDEYQDDYFSWEKEV